MTNTTTKTVTYTCSGFRNLPELSLSRENLYPGEYMAYAAGVFAERLARREYGVRGYVRTHRLDSYAENGSWATYEVFIGVNRGDVCVGHSEWLTVHKEVRP